MYYQRGQSFCHKIRRRSSMCQPSVILMCYQNHIPIHLEYGPLQVGPRGLASCWQRVWTISWAAQVSGAQPLHYQAWHRPYWYGKVKTHGCSIWFLRRLCGNCGSTGVPHHNQNPLCNTYNPTTIRQTMKRIGLSKEVMSFFIVMLANAVKSLRQQKAHVRPVYNRFSIRRRQYGFMRDEVQNPIRIKRPSADRERYYSPQTTQKVTSQVPLKQFERSQRAKSLRQQKSQQSPVAPLEMKVATLVCSYCVHI